ncbi:MAG: SDR family NAD(P)-dependent oxidoreductase [Pseudomonadota bacterium]
MQPNILVTGGAGFVGSHLVDALINQGYNLRVLDNFSTGQWENLTHNNDKLEIIKGDVRDLESVMAAIKGVKWIFHQAAFVSAPLSIKQPQISFENNLLGTFNIFEAVRRQGSLARIIFASSAAVYGDNHSLPLHENLPCFPLNPYAFEKNAAEQLAVLYERLYKVSSVALRYFNIYGPRQSASSPYSGVISKFIDQLKKGEKLTIYGDGEQTRDFVYINDVISANLEAMKKVPPGAHLFNVATGKSVTINQLVKSLQKNLKTFMEPQYQSSREGDIYHSLADISKIYEQLGWYPKWDLAQGLSDWLR